jgi:TolB-like protein/tetratricopeptide (TPR) repeat protein
MFTDIVGYSTLTQTDERLALALLDEHRGLLRPLFTRYNGEEVKTIGDAFLVSFHSALEAVECASEIQRELQRLNGGRPPCEQIWTRIGIHLGDVAFQEGDVFGDGVNVAARLQPLAPPGGICVSKAVFDAIRRSTQVVLRPMGRPRLKGMRESVEIYHILPLDPAGIQPQSSLVPKPPFWRRHPGIIAISAGFLALAVLFLLLLRHAGPARTKGAEDAAVPSVAVLAFENLSPDPEKEYFADGLTEELIDALAHIEGLKVCARTSAFAFKGKREDIRAIGRKLGVRYVMEGSVRSEGDRIKVAAQLIAVKDGFQLWAQIFEREMKDLFGVQAEISRAIADNLKVRVVPSERRPFRPDFQPAPEAYHAYLKGRFFWNKRSEEGARQAIAFFNKALEEEPRYALAYAGLADVHLFSTGARFEPPDQGFLLAERFALKALELDPMLAEPQATLGCIRSNRDWDWTAARAFFQKALVVKPGYATGHQWYSLLLARIGEFEPAIREAQEAYRLDPLSPVVVSQYANTLGQARLYGPALEHYREVILLDPRFMTVRLNMGLVFMHQGRFREGLKELEAYSPNTPNWKVAKDTVLGCIYARWGKMEEARSYLQRVEEAKAGSELSFLPFLALLRAALKDRGSALQALERALEARDDRILGMHQGEAFDFLRSDPEFIALMKHSGLSPNPNFPDPSILNKP